MDDGFWLFMILQLAALGPFADAVRIAGLKRHVLLGGVAASLAAAFCTLLLGYGGIAGDGARNALKLTALVALMFALAATAASVAMPENLFKKRA